MGKVILDMAMSLDGFIAAEDKKYIYPVEDIKKTKEFKQLVKDAGAVIMDMDGYSMAKGDFTHYEYQVPIYVLAAKHPLKMAKGENKQLKFTFITTGIDDAVAKAKAAAGRKNVMIIGLTDAAQQAIKLKKVDEVILRIVPVNFEKGIKLFENFGKKKIKLKIIESTQYPTRIDIKAKVRS